jgi:hypothetical protein
MFDKSLFIKLSFGFIIATIVGTLSHELGHYIVAYFYGYKPHISYGYCTWDLTLAKPHYDIKDDFYICLGGPLQTILTGTFGLVLLILNRKKYLSVDNLNFIQWVAIFITLFWLRQTTNYVIELVEKVFINNRISGGDEFLIADYLKINTFFISGLSALIGLTILTLVVFKFVPSRQRLTFILSGLIGGVLGFIIWLEFIGQILLP